MDSLMKTQFEELTDKPTRLITVRFMASMTTDLEHIEQLKVPASATQDEINNALYEYQRENIDGGDYKEVDGSGSWSNTGFDITDTL